MPKKKATKKKPPVAPPVRAKKTAKKKVTKSESNSATSRSPARKRKKAPPRRTAASTAGSAAAAYEQKKVAENNKQRQQNADKREIGAIPPAKNRARRAACQTDFDKFLRTYFPKDCRHPWSEKHVRLIRNIENVVLVGGLQAVGFPRGWAKTFITVRAIMWAGMFRHHTLMMMIAASDDAAAALLQDIVDEICTNTLLQEDFPEFCLPIAALENIRQRGKGQTSQGEATNVKQSDYMLHLGDVNGDFGVIIWAGGITGSKIRGKRKKRGDRIERPTLGLVDDFQTDASAQSKNMTRKRVKLINGAIKGLPGNDQSWACLLTCTVIEQNDGADQLLDRKQFPDWRGIRESFLSSLPNDDALEHWEEWWRLHSEFMQTCDVDVDDIQPEAIAPAAQAYYRKHYKAMNAGAGVVWEYAYDPQIYVDALEKAMHWYFGDREAFWCELMNQPDKFADSGLPQLTSQILIRRWHHLTRHKVPAGVEYITAHADVSKRVLWYELRAWLEDSTSYSIDYGTWPSQSRAYYTQATAKTTIDSVYSKLPTWEIRCMKAIADLFGPLFERQFVKEDGSTMRLNIAGIDANDETETVREGIRKAGLAGLLWPMHSRSFRGKTALNELPVRDGDKLGPNWRRRNPSTGNMRYITYDTDAWKSHHRDRLMMPKECPGALTWFKAYDHKMLADHHVAEWSENVAYEKQGCTIEQWTNRPNADNHLWDVGVGNDVLGSVIGARLPADVILGAPNASRRTKRTKRTKRKASASI